MGPSGARKMGDKSDGRSTGGRKGPEGTRQKEGSLRRWLPGPGPAQAPPGPWSPGRTQTLPRPGWKTRHAGLGIEGR